MAHLLIHHSHRFTPSREDVTEGWRYAREIGMWVEDQSMGQGRPGPRPVSKKADDETGEDMKGE